MLEREEVNVDMMRWQELCVEWVSEGGSAGQDVIMGGSEQLYDSLRALGPWKPLKREKSCQLSLGHVRPYFFLGLRLLEIKFPDVHKRLNTWIVMT